MVGKVWAVPLVAFLLAGCLGGGDEAGDEAPVLPKEALVRMSNTGDDRFTVHVRLLDADGSGLWAGSWALPPGQVREHWTTLDAAARHAVEVTYDWPAGAVAETGDAQGGDTVDLAKRCLQDDVVRFEGGARWTADALGGGSYETWGAWHCGSGSA